MLLFPSHTYYSQGIDVNLLWEELLRFILQQHAMLRSLSLRSSRRGLGPKPTGMCFPMKLWGAKFGVFVHKGAAHCWREGHSALFGEEAAKGEEEHLGMCTAPVSHWETSQSPLKLQSAVGSCATS